MHLFFLSPCHDVAGEEELQNLRSKCEEAEKTVGDFCEETKKNLENKIEGYENERNDILQQLADAKSENERLKEQLDQRATDVESLKRETRGKYDELQALHSQLVRFLKEHFLLQLQ